MRWLAFSILAYVILGLQSGVDSFVRIDAGGSVLAELNLVLIAVVFICVYAPKREALIACVIMGALQDIVTQQPFGLFAFGYGLIALGITSVSQTMHRSHPLTHFTFALAGGLLMTIILVVHGWIHPASIAMTHATVALPAMRESAGLYVGSALYTAIAAPFVIFVLQRFKKVFGFQGGRQRMRMR